MEAEIKDYYLEEYHAIRAEILQYLEEFQTVRNMMFTVTGTLLGFGVGTDRPYLLLLPLLVIIPSYFIAIDYEKCVNVAAAYLKVFYEQKDGFPAKWETRKVYLDVYLRKASEKYVPIFNKRDLPYKVSALACVVIYFGFWCVNHLSHWFEVGSIECIGVQGIAELALGVVALIAVLVTIFRFKSVSFEDCWKAWQGISRREQKGNIALDVQKAYAEINSELITVGIFKRIRWILSGKKPTEASNIESNSTDKKGEEQGTTLETNSRDESI